MKYKAGFRPAELLNTCDNIWRPFEQLCSREVTPNLDDAYQAAALGTLPQSTHAVYDNPSEIESNVPSAGCIYDGMVVPGGMPVFMVCSILTRELRTSKIENVLSHAWRLWATSLLPN